MQITDLLLLWGLLLLLGSSLLLRRGGLAKVQQWVAEVLIEVKGMIIACHESITIHGPHSHLLLWRSFLLGCGLLLLLDHLGNQIGAGGDQKDGGGQTTFKQNRQSVGWLVV